MSDQKQPEYKGLPIVLSAPSGGGKSTIAEEIMSRVSGVVRSISCTTREPRGDERNGTDYFFISKKEFKKKADAGDFLEWAVVHDHYYGTPIRALTEKLKNGNDVLLVIDPQGAVSVRKVYPNGVFIFIIPPTWEMLEGRLRSRGTDDENIMKKRLLNARKELGYIDHYDYVVVNDDLKGAVSDVAAIIRSEHLHSNRVDKKNIAILR